MSISTLAYSAPKAELWPYWQTSNENNPAHISHKKWQQLLSRYVITQGENTLFRYADVTAKDKAQLAQYIQQLATLNPLTYSKAEQYAYWVNLYNAITVNLVIKHYPITSITKLGGLFSFGPWNEDVVKINGKTLTLNNIEHRILRPIWQDPRTHYAVNCASLGCPNLQPTAFTAENTQALLNHAAKTFINSKKGVNIESGKATLSSIYTWFAQDFGNPQALWQHIQHYAPQYRQAPSSISYEYDWNLNDAAK